MSGNSHSPGTVSRRSFLAGAAVCAGLFSIKAGAVRGPGRVVMLGFDGMEPKIVREMLERGELPNLDRLRQSGAFAELATTAPPQSPVAWNSFATCVNPGGHNIFDFIRRNPAGAAGPLPLVGTGKLEPAALGPDGAVTAPAHGVTYRKGTPFWAAADGQGLSSRILNVPFIFPSDPLKHGSMLCGLGVPDLRGTTSTYFSLSDRFSPEELSEKLAGGRRLPLQFDGSDSAVVELTGPRDARVPFGRPGAYAPVELRISVDRQAGRGRVESGGKQVELARGEWSDWLELHFKVSDKYAVEGITRFYPMALGTGEGVRLYAACAQFHPRAPYAPFTHPDDYAASLAERFGLYKTVGWSYDTNALRQNDLDEDAFLKDVEQTMAWHERLTLDELDRGGADLFISAWTATDRVGHMFWRFRDGKHPLHDPGAPERWRTALEMTYRKADAITGRVMERLRGDDTLFVLSDHGFGTWRTGFHLNTWLRDNGYLAVADPRAAAGGFLQGVDWANTRAYSVGLSSLYLNLKGRETVGVVSPDGADALIAELREKLAGVKDPATGAPVFAALHPRGVNRGGAMDQAPDIVLGYAAAYQSAKDCALGAVGEALFEPNADKWGGEHAATDAALCPGMLFSNRKLEKDAPHIQDLGVTALKLLGADIPSGYEGTPVV